MSFWLSRICEEFPCLSPSAAIEEIDRLPVGLLTEIIEARNYAEAFHAVKRAHESSQKAPNTPLCQLVQEIESGIAAREWAAERDAADE